LSGFRRRSCDAAAVSWSPPALFDPGWAGQRRMGGPRSAAFAFSCALGSCALGLAAGPLRAESPPAPKPAPSSDEGELSAKRLQLRGVEDTISASEEQKRKIESEIATLQTERERLNQTLLDATARLRATEESAQEVEKRLDELTIGEDAIVQSLQSRRALVGEVLLVLQRMGRRPPPALLAQPEDILEAIRASMAMGAVLPQMRAEMAALQIDLEKLSRLRDDIRDQQANLLREKESLNVQRANLAPMIEARQKALKEAETARAAQSERARALAAQASGIKDLIAKMEAESEAARRAAQAARDADARREADDAALSREQRAAALSAPFHDPARLAPAVAFADLKGRLPLPASGQILRRFGAPDGYGGTEKGMSLAAREKGVVIAPADGWIAFSGPYRSYGQLLIINAGGGYYVVLAGMARINVSVGQFVLAGEPVASMGDGSAQTAATIAIGAKQPILYVEFRKDGNSIDPGPWWARSDMRKVGG
jgi:murein hydrolase activator